MRFDSEQIIIFYHVASANGFSKAAQLLGVSKAQVSKQIALLENAMQIKLFERTTRRLVLTLAGEQLFNHSKKIVSELRAAEESMAALHDEPKGLLKVTAPPAYGAHILSRKIPSFLKKYPDVQLSLNLTSNIIDLFKERIDVAIRLTHTPPEDRIGKLIGHYQLLICASTEYLAKNNLPNTPHELSQHPCIIYGSDKVNTHWPFIINNNEVNIEINAALACDSYEIALNATLNHCGIARLPSYVIEEEVQNGNMKVLLRDYMPAQIPIYAVYAQSKFMQAKLKAFIDFLMKE